jgi:hypothetical protein
MKLRRGEYEVDGTPAEVAELLQRIDFGEPLSEIRKLITENRKLTVGDVWTIPEEELRAYVRQNPWHGPGFVAEHFLGRNIYSTGEDRSVYHALYRRIGNARDYWTAKHPGWNKSLAVPAK